MKLLACKYMLFPSATPLPLAGLPFFYLMLILLVSSQQLGLAVIRPQVLAHSPHALHMSDMLIQP